MAHSTNTLDLVIIADADASCAWTTPALAARMCAVNPTLEIIPEDHPHYQAYLRAAGPKPQIIIPPKEGYSDEEE